MDRKLFSLCVSIALGFASTAFAADQEEYSQPVGKDYPQSVYWGDTHLHTRNSADAYSIGNRNLTPIDAYRFAQGQEILAHNGMRVRLRRPLDFLVVSDHSEYLGGYVRFAVGDPLVVNTDAGRQWLQYLKDGDPIKMMTAFTASLADPVNNYPFSKSTQSTIWQDVAQTADEHNRPGVFTAFTGYEWTSMINGNNLHRVVVYKDSAARAAQLPPFTGQDSLDPRDLWAALENYEKVTGGEVMAIAHNGNISNGMMFPDKSVDGKPLNRAYAEMRARWEPIYEVTQVKGDGEAHPTLSPDDEFADFENWDWDNIGRTQAKEDWMLKHEYARGALKLGLAYEKKLGVNPFKFGMIGSTDGHNSLSTSQEDNFFGKFPESEPSVERTQNSMANNVLWQNWRLVASGFAAVWARENTRESLFEAMRRREVYATTGSRITVRFFGGWDYGSQDAARPNYLDTAYEKGVPMGGDLTAAPKKNAPDFIVFATKDPDGPNLDRVQIVKGWLDRKGSLQEKVYDIAWSGDRTADARTGKIPAVGSTVNVKEATYSNTIGTTNLSTVWTDPDFDPKEKAFYYVRVIEIPRPRWTAYDAAYFGLDLPDEIPMIIQDRAYTSPIWYTP
ncbi:MAG: hypothetical protein CMQ20_09320 [Gammaproteobacteria bacterium]|jgi:hypothetical protein|nr:hypothetical protein [Gammaproteobacteria bacterium]